MEVFDGGVGCLKFFIYDDERGYSGGGERLKKGGRRISGDVAVGSKEREELGGYRRREGRKRRVVRRSWRKGGAGYGMLLERKDLWKWKLNRFAVPLGKTLDVEVREKAPV